jgi:hypothetical protein
MNMKLMLRFVLEQLHPDGLHYIHGESIEEWVTDYIRYVRYTHSQKPFTRMLEAEQIVKQIPKLATWYAVHVIKSRWPEAEPAIMKDAELWKHYKYMLL